MLTVYTIDQAEQWDAIVRSFAEYDVYWLSGYVKAFQIHGDGKPLLIFVDNGATRGINVVMLRDIANDDRFLSSISEGKYYDLSTPYGYGGWLIEGNQIEELLDDYLRWVINKGVISEFVRFHPMIGNHAKCNSFYDVIQLGNVVHMDLSSPEIIWNNITSKNRNMIRKAIKNNVKIYNGRFPEIFEKFRVIYNKTMGKDNAEEYFYFHSDFYTSILEDLPQNAQVFWAEKDELVIAASIMIAANGRMNYHLSGSLREYSSLAATNLLLYKAALWGCANNYKTLFLGGGVGSGEDSLFRFKKAFYRGKLNSFYIGKRVYDQERYDELVKIRGSVDSGFFPKYRA